MRRGSSKRVLSVPFYHEWSGHPIEDLELVHEQLRNHNNKRRNVIFFAGDSSLDNKYWILHTSAVAAVNGYEHVLDPPRSYRDVAYWMNHVLLSNGDGDSTVCLNTAIEATTLGERASELLPQDRFVRDNIERNDSLVVSVGGNDIALKPTMSTIFNMLRLAKCTSMKTLQSVTKDTPIKKLPGGYGYFVRMFRDQIRDYILRMTAKVMPRVIVVCLIYFPDEKTTGSWADFSLGCMGYNKNPAKLQLMIDTIFQKAVCGIKIPGTKVVPFPLFSVLDGKNTTDYQQRVEPSVQGGQKMAVAIHRAWKEAISSGDDVAGPQEDGTAEVATSAASGSKM